MDADALLSVISRRDLAIMLRYPFSVLNCRFCSPLHYIFVNLCIRSLMHSLSVTLSYVYIHYLSLIKYFVARIPLSLVLF